MNGQRTALPPRRARRDRSAAPCRRFGAPTSFRRVVLDDVRLERVAAEELFDRLRALADGFEDALDAAAVVLVIGSGEKSSATPAAAVIASIISEVCVVRIAARTFCGSTRSLTAASACCWLIPWLIPVKRPKGDSGGVEARASRDFGFRWDRSTGASGPSDLKHRRNRDPPQRACPLSAGDVAVLCRPEAPITTCGRSPAAAVGRRCGCRNGRGNDGRTARRPPSPAPRAAGRSRS